MKGFCVSLQSLWANQTARALLQGRLAEERGRSRALAAALEERDIRLHDAGATVGVGPTLRRRAGHGPRVQVEGRGTWREKRRVSGCTHGRHPMGPPPLAAPFWVRPPRPRSQIQDRTERVSRLTADVALLDASLQDSQRRAVDLTARLQARARAHASLPVRGLAASREGGVRRASAPSGRPPRV
jgi:hypothetical protein